MEDSKTYVFGQDSNLLSTLMPLLTQKGIDPNLLAMLNNGNMGFGNGGFFWWIFLLFLFGGWGNGGWGNNGFGGNTGFIANQMNNDAGRELLLQAIQGNGNAISQLATNMNISSTRIGDAVNATMSAIQSVGSQVGMSGLQTINAIQSGNASLAAQLAQCCCENRLLTTEQGYQSQIRTLEQTNQLGSQADRNYNALSNEISGLKASMIEQFCELERRELQSKIDTQGDIITQLRGQIDNDRQTAQFYNMIAPLQAKVNEIANKQPNTVPVTYPNLVAVNNTPYSGIYGYNGGSYWG